MTVRGMEGMVRVRVRVSARLRVSVGVTVTVTGDLLTKHLRDHLNKQPLKETTSTNMC